MKPTGGEGERQAGTTPIFPKKTEEPFLTTSLTSSGYVINNSDTYAKVRDPAVSALNNSHDADFDVAPPAQPQPPEDVTPPAVQPQPSEDVTPPEQLQSSEAVTPSMAQQQPSESEEPAMSTW